MRIVLTGATGFLGSALWRRFKADKNDVICFVRKESKLIPSDIQQIVGDLIDLPIKEDNNFFRILKKADVVVHAAARAHITNSSSDGHVSNFLKMNCDVTLALARMACKAGVKRFVFLSSIGVNGNLSVRPYTELDVVHPHNSYSLSKFQAEKALMALAKKSKMEVVIIRPPLVYGPNAPGNFGSLLRWVNSSLPLPFGAVKNSRSLVALDNLVDFITLCSSPECSPKAANEVFLISDGVDVSTSDLLRKVANAFGVKSRLLPVPVGLMKFIAKLLGKDAVTDRLFGNLQVDSSKARYMLGWKPVVTMEEQLAKIAKSNDA